jgi:hypothetical protein
MSKHTQLFPITTTIFRTLCLAGSLIPGVGTAQPATQITVIGRDYAFGAPDSLRAGATLFTFSNQGTVAHEVVILLLKEGHTLAEYLQAKTPQERRPMNDALIGLILAGPGQSAPGQLLTTLQKNRTYVLICNLRDAPDKPPHSALGMAKLLYVK